MPKPSFLKEELVLVLDCKLNLVFYCYCIFADEGIGVQATNAQVFGGCYPRMPLINITVEGIEKLLDKLNPYKVAGPDNLQH